MTDFLLPNAVDAIVAKGDIGHLALLLWAGFSSALCFWALGQLVKANRRFDDFVREIALLTKVLGERA